MHPDPILRRLHACVLVHVPAVLWGSPGVGKTARVRAYSEAVGAHYERWILSRCEGTDLKPRSSNDKGEVIVSEPPERRRALAAEKALLFLDELNRAPRETESAALDIIDASPKHVAVVVACNPPSRGQAARSLDAATANRFCHFDVAPDVEAWARAQIAGWPAIEADFPGYHGGLDAAMGQARALVSGYVRSQPADLDACPDNPIAAGRPWPSPRSWDAAARVYGAAMALGLDMSDVLALVSGCVGGGTSAADKSGATSPGVALKFLAYVADLDLPDPEVLLADPAAYTPRQGRVDRTVATLSAVVAALVSSGKPLTAARWDAAWQLVTRVTEADQADAGMVAGTLLLEIYQSRIDAATKSRITPPTKLVPLRLAKLIVASKAAP